jgi:hypothetical protein
MSREAVGPAKKPYQPPKFSMYGDLTELTKTTPSGKGQKDGATMGQKT